MNRRGWILGVVLMAGAGWYLFRPERLFVNSRVNEGLITASASAVPGERPKEPMVVLSGRFHSVAHETRGTASVHELGDGYSSAAPDRFHDVKWSRRPRLSDRIFGRLRQRDRHQGGLLELGKLKGNVGDQNYGIPAGTDLAKYRAVTIWCRRFGVNFATAPLTQLPETGEGPCRSLARCHSQSPSWRWPKAVAQGAPSATADQGRECLGR